jgi:hypothetical protein
VVTRVQTGRSGAQIPVGATDLLFYKDFSQTVSMAHTASHPLLRAAPSSSPGTSIWRRGQELMAPYLYYPSAASWCKLEQLMMADIPILGIKCSKSSSVHPTLPDETTFTKFGKEHKAQRSPLRNVSHPSFQHPVLKFTLRHVTSVPRQHKTTYKVIFPNILIFRLLTPAGTQNVLNTDIKHYSNLIRP